jgi:5-methylcytosine-specific restriction endonuclease McrA
MSLGIYAVTHKRGDIREDGKIFYKYQKGCKNGERWITTEQFDAYKKQANEYGTAKYHEDTETWKARHKNWRNNNLEKAREKSRNWNCKNKERVKKNSKEWRSKNKHIINFHSNKRRKTIQNACLMLHKDQENIIKTIYETSSRIGECLEIPHHVDHIVPLSKGGFHVHTNMQILPARTNRIKNNKMPEEFAAN